MAKEKVEIITQWGIYNSTGYGLKFYERLKKGKGQIVCFHGGKGGVVLSWLIILERTYKLLSLDYILD